MRLAYKIKIGNWQNLWVYGMNKCTNFEYIIHFHAYPQTPIIQFQKPRIVEFGYGWGGEHTYRE